MSNFYNDLLNVFQWVLENSLVSSVMVGFILLIKIILRNKLPARWHYLIWLILIIRLILPPIPEGLYNIHNVLLSSQHNFVSTTPLKSTNEININTVDQSRPFVNEEKATTQKNETKTQLVSFDKIVLYLWVLGVVGFGILAIISNVRLMTYINRQPLISDDEVTQLLNLCKSQMSIKRHIPIVFAGKLSSPTVSGFFQPRILLSRNQIEILNDQQLKFVFYHELAHIKRNDVLINCLMNGILILHWFNPILWFAYNRMRQDQEIGCDALALHYVEPGQVTEYGHTIIKLLDTFSRRFPLSNVANMSRGHRIFKRRILMIKQFNKKSYRWSILGIVSVVGLSLFSFVNADAKTNIVTKKEDTVYTPPIQKENFNDVTKEEILTKMINTVDNFETAKGEFKTHTVNYGGTQDDMLIDYELSLKNNAGGYCKTSSIFNGKEEAFYSYYKDGTEWNLTQNTGTYTETKYQDPPRQGTLTIKEAFTKTNKGEDVTAMRERPPIGIAYESLFPYEIASNYTRDLNDWVIESQNEELLGRNTVVIKGTLNDYARIKHSSNTFRFWVDKSTGILVKYETYNSAGNVVNYLYPTKLEINTPIDSKHFIPKLDGYKKFDRSLIKKGPGIMTGNIDNEIPKELKVQWEEAKKKTNDTTILHKAGKWYISAKKGYLVDRIEVNGKAGTLLLAKTSTQKSQFIFHAVADGYNMDRLKVVYE